MKTNADMLINFALDVVGTKITSDKVSTDGHECSNLISSSWHLRRKGFLAEYFIKPPVNLTFNFPCNICIHHVFVTPCVGQQMSSHLELYSASKFRHGAVNRFHTPASTENLSNPPVISHPLSSGFYPVSKMYVTSGDRICFYNPKVSDLFSSATVDSAISDHQRAEMRHFRQELISTSSHLTLRIARTVSGSTAAVSSIDIWGMPAVSVPTAIKNDIVSKYSSFINQSFAEKEKKTVTLNSDINVSSSATSCVVEGREFEIPDDFLDPITCEVMSIPMLLPSGKNVDLSTLDSYFNVEASYGRQPKDPFTGLQFSSSVKPIPNGALKTRIDKFLMEHCDDAATSSVARTVRAGTNASLLGKRKHSGNTNDGVSILISQSSGRETFHTVKHDQTKVSINEAFQNSTHGNQQSPLVSKSTNLDNSKKSHHTEVSQNLPRKQQASCFYSGTKNGCSDHSHETQLKSSLNDALSSVLNNLPSYLSSSQHSADSDLCFSCKGTLAVDKISYVTPCHHFICRECLTSDSTNSSVTCGVCEHIFTKNNVLRRHQV